MLTATFMTTRAERGLLRRNGERPSRGGEEYAGSTDVGEKSISRGGEGEERVTEVAIAGSRKGGGAQISLIST